jgi:archaellum component FlaC
MDEEPQKPSSDDSEETYLLSYKIMVSKLNGWKLNEELARKLELYDELTEDLGKPEIGRGSLKKKKETTEKSLAKLEKQIEILRERTRRRTTISNSSR